MCRCVYNHYIWHFRLLRGCIILRIGYSSLKERAFLHCSPYTERTHLKAYKARMAFFSGQAQSDVADSFIQSCSTAGRPQADNLQRVIRDITSTKLMSRDVPRTSQGLKESIDSAFVVCLPSVTEEDFQSQDILTPLNSKQFILQFSSATYGTLAPLDKLFAFEESYYEFLVSPDWLHRDAYPQVGGVGFESLLPNLATYPPVVTSSPLFGIDCEMVVTTKTTYERKALARISVVNESGSCIYDTYVKPDGDVIDYRSQFSGITAATFHGVNTTLQDVQRKLKELIPPNAILVGHSLEMDLHAMKFAHPYIIDTAFLFVQYKGPGRLTFKPSLKFLASSVLGKVIQQSQRGHDSIEDARITIELVKKRKAIGATLCEYRRSSKQWVKLPNALGSQKDTDFPSYLTSYGTKVAIVDTQQPKKVSRVECHNAVNDNAALDVMTRTSSFHHGFTWVTLRNCPSLASDTRRATVKQYLERVIGSVPRRSLVIVIGGRCDDPKVTECPSLVIYKK